MFYKAIHILRRDCKQISQLGFSFKGRNQFSERLKGVMFWVLTIFRCSGQSACPLANLSATGVWIFWAGLDFCFLPAY